MKTFFEYLNKNDLSPQKLIKTIDSWSATRINNFLLESHDYIKYSKIPSNASIFDFASSSGLSGEPVECSDINCRLSKANQLAIFASLYANRVVIVNPLPSFISFHPGFKYDLIGSLMVLYLFQPLLEEDIIHLTPRELTLCKECNKDLKELEGQIKVAAKELIRPLLKDVNISYEARKKNSIVKISGPEIIFGHDTSVLQSSKKIDDLKRHRKSTYVMNYLSPVLSDILFQKLSSKRNYTNFITDSEFYIELVNEMEKGKTNTFHYSNVDGLSHWLPFVDDVNIKKLLLLRKKEGESFAVYRDAVSKALKEGTPLNIVHFKTIFNDIILPELNKIELTIKNSKKLLYNSVKKELVISSGFIGISLFSGILTPHLSEMLLALGGYSFISGVANKIGDVLTEPLDIKNNDFYFLWKARKILQK